MVQAVQAFSTSNVDSLRSFPVRGDAMAPTFNRGDFALTVPCDDFAGDGVYILGVEDPYIVRAYKRGAGFIRLAWDNERYPAIDVSKGWFRENVIAQVAMAVTVIDRELVPSHLRV